MQKQVSEILADFSSKGLINLVQGPNNTITNMPPVESCNAGGLVFVERDEFVAAAKSGAPAAIVTTQELTQHFLTLSNTDILVSNNVRLAQALIKQAYIDRNVRDNGWQDVHSSAVIHESARLADNVSIGPGVAIARDAVIGRNSVIMANCVIEEEAVVGADTIIHPNVTLSYQCELGERCIIKAGTVIGMEGFGFAQDAQRKSHRIPQLGKVVIGNDVVIGTNSNIDRAAFHETRIADGCKLDALVHVGHGVEIGEDGLLCAHTCIAGTTKIGKRVICSGQTGIIDHLKICDDVVLVQRAGVIADIEEPGMYAGHPIQPVRQFFKNTTLALGLADMKKTIRGLEKKLLALMPGSNQEH